MLRLFSLYLMGLLVLGLSGLLAQPTNGAMYWSTTPPDCTSLGESAPVSLKTPAGTTVYSCYVTASFLFDLPAVLAPGLRGTVLRVAAPASGAIGVDYSFSDSKGQALSVDVSGSSTSSGSDITFALYANQPAALNLLGATKDGPNYFAAISGTIQAVFYCPDATTCSILQPQLFSIQLPDIQGVLRGDAATAGGTNMAIFWDRNVWTQYSTAVVLSTPNDQINLTFYNQDSTSASYTASVFDLTGKLLGTQTTPPAPREAFWQPPSTRRPSRNCPHFRDW